ncbi:MAG: tRNA-dihydrouridine synthase [Candidatus Saccharimonadales bacterium]
MSTYPKLSKPFFVLAPMDDVTDTVFRQIVASCAAPDLYFTEFVNVDGLQSPGRPHLLPKLAFGPKETPIIAQIWGKTPGNYYQTTKELKAMGFAGVDINMGCPAKTVVRNGCCSGLIDNRGLAGEIIKATQEAAGDDFPVSVKTRLGLSSVDMTWPEFLLGFKLNMLTMHGRTRKQMSKVPADWDLIGQVRELRDRISPTTLMVGNGDVTSRQHGLELAAKYKLDGIMVGRGLFEDPYLFSKDSPWPEQTRQQRIDLYKRHVKLFADTWQHNERRIQTLNKFCKVYISGFDGAKELREQLMDANSTDQLLSLLDAVPSAPVGHLG